MVKSFNDLTQWSSCPCQWAHKGLFTQGHVCKTQSNLLRFQIKLNSQSDGRILMPRITTNTVKHIFGGYFYLALLEVETKIDKI